MIKKNLFFVTILTFAIFLSAPAFAKKGFWLGAEGTFGFTSMSWDGSGSTAEDGNVYGGGVTLEYNFNNVLGIASGLGIKYYDFKIVGSTFTQEANNTVLNIPVTVRLRPMPWFSKDSNFTFFLGAGVDIQSTMSSEIKNSNGTTSTGKFKDNFGIILEAGIGYYFTKRLLAQFDFEYNIGLSNINTGTSDLKPSMINFNLGIGYKLF